MTEANEKPTPDDNESSTPQEQPDTTSADGVPRRRSRAFRQELLGRLPSLVAPHWQSAETLNIYQELQGIVDVDADAFLEPLEAIAEKHHE